MEEVQVQLARRTAVDPSVNVARIAAMFGLGVDRSRRVDIVPKTKLRLDAGQVVFITGPSGGGKSTFLRLLDRALRSRAHLNVVRFDRLPQPPDRPLVDAFGAQHSLHQVMAALSVAGLNDAFVMLRKPTELSDGQRYRLRLAQTLLTPRTQQSGAADADHSLTVILADEFASTLDRTTAKAIAQNVRKWVSRRRGVCFVAATTHDDLLEHLDPDVLVEKGLADHIRVAYRSKGQA